jgi:hypothetical protein
VGSNPTRAIMKNIDYPKELRKMYVGNYNMVIIHDAADEIERLQNQIKSWEERFNEVCKERDEFWDMFDKARGERDEARRIACGLIYDQAPSPATKESIAEAEGWDCYKENP